MEWFRDHGVEAWLAIAILFGLAEMLSLDLVLAMLAVGALASLVTAAVGAPFLLQFLVAGGASVAMLALLRLDWVTWLHTGPELRLGHGNLVFTEALTTETV